MGRTMFLHRRSQPQLGGTWSTSPDQSVTEEAPAAWRARCAGCSACSDLGEDDAAWLWVDDHRCGVETIRLP